MNGTDELLMIIKQAAIEAVSQSEPVTVVYGNVIETEPLTIRIEQKLFLTKEFLILTKEVKEKLTKGKVVLIKVQGGQKYLVFGMAGD